MSARINMKEMLEAGAHYGHQCRRWNPKMKRYIFGARNGVHIIDLQKTSNHLKKAFSFIENTASRGGKILFVGTKKQAREIVAAEAERCGMFFINHRWLGGTLTNYQTIKQSIQQLKNLEKMAEDGTYEKLTKKEVLGLENDKFKLNRNLGGIKELKGRPDALFIIDAHKEQIAVKEAQKLGIPIVALADTNADPEGIDYIIPANDDSLRSIQLFTAAMADACLAGKAKTPEVKEEDAEDSAKSGSFYDQTGHSVKVMKKEKKEESK